MLKNFLFKSSKLLFILVLVLSWVFSGWPQIYNFPPETDLARAATVTKTYSFPSDSESWSNTACGSAGATCAWLSSDGSPANGSLNGVEIRKNKSGTYTWQLSGVTWESLGVPAGSTVTEVDGAYNHKAAVCTDCVSTSGDLLIRNSGDSVTIATLETAVSYSVATAWATRNASGVQAVGASYQASNTSIILRITGTLGNANVNGASTDIRQDEITFTITYTPPAATAALTGTVTGSITEADIVAGGETIILTLTNDTWVASGATFDAERQNIINGLDSAQSEGTGWDAEVKAKEVVGAVVRTSDTVVTITLSAQAAYNITATETITATIPASALVTSTNPVVATPTFSITAVADNNPPTKPTNQSPSGGATGVGVNPTLTGSTYSDPDSDPHANTEWNVDNDSDLLTPVWVRTAGSGEESTVVNSTNGLFVNELGGQTQLAFGTVYYWRVRYSDGTDWSSWSDATSFTTEAATVSVSLDVNNFAYGSTPENTASSTLTLFGGAGIIATNDGDVTADFDIYGANTANWTLAGATGTNQYIHQFCNDTDNDCTSPPTNYTALTTSPQDLKNSVAVSGTVAFQLRITTPDPSTVYTQQNAVVTVQASAP